ncbi:MAG TPA: tetratricopeptide repeat protein [Pyrinomonadaceae bacterium]|nr:tetratricopeptide repeat protein [Pyrinomonadaceae bacterium]
MRKAVFVLILLILPQAIFAQVNPQPFDLTQYGVKIEPDRRLIVVSLALEAAGLDTPMTDKGTEFKNRVRADLDGLSPELVQKMKFFIEQYRKRHSTATPAEVAAPFISMAYSLGPVPDLNEPARATDLPGDLLEVLDFSPLVRQFYRSIVRRGEQSYTISQKVEEYYKEYQALGDLMRPTTVRMVRDVLAYLHTKPTLVYTETVKTEIQRGKSKSEKLRKTEYREHERRFFVVPDMFAAPGTVNFRNIGDDYYAIVPPATELDDSEARRAYLQFVLDPIVLKNSADVVAMKTGIRALLDERRKVKPEISPDFMLAVSRSIVAAVDARQPFHQRFQAETAEARRNSGKKPISETVDSEGRKVVQLTPELYLIDGRFQMPRLEDELTLRLAEAYESGAVLSFYFAQQLKGLEESEFDIASVFRDMVLSFDASKESNRLQDSDAARKRAIAYREERRKEALSVVENPVTKRLLEIEPMIKGQKYIEADKELKALLNANPSDLRIYYALGRVKSLSAAAVTDVEERNEFIKEAQAHFSNLLTLAKDTPGTDPALISLTYVALGRLYEYYDQNEYAIRIYEAAIKIGDVKGGGYFEAIAARERLLKKQ